MDYKLFWDIDKNTKRRISNRSHQIFKLDFSMVKKDKEITTIELRKGNRFDSYQAYRQAVLQNEDFDCYLDSVSPLLTCFPESLRLEILHKDPFQHISSVNFQTLDTLISNILPENLDHTCTVLALLSIYTKLSNRLSSLLTVLNISTPLLKLSKVLTEIPPNLCFHLSNLLLALSEDNGKQNKIELIHTIIFVLKKSKMIHKELIFSLCNFLLNFDDGIEEFIIYEGFEEIIRLSEECRVEDELLCVTIKALSAGHGPIVETLIEKGILERLNLLLSIENNRIREDALESLANFAVLGGDIIFSIVNHEVFMTSIEHLLNHNEKIRILASQLILNSCTYSIAADKFTISRVSLTLLCKSLSLTTSPEFTNNLLSSIYQLLHPPISLNLLEPATLSLLFDSLHSLSCNSNPTISSNASYLLKIFFN